MNNQTSTLATMMGTLDGSVKKSRQEALKTKLKSHIIDTVCPVDTNTWETGIKPKGKSWIIVEQYASKKEAIKGHEKWIEDLKKNPKLKLKDVMDYGF